MLPDAHRTDQPATTRYNIYKGTARHGREFEIGFKKFRRQPQQAGPAFIPGADTFGKCLSEQVFTGRSHGERLAMALDLLADPVFDRLLDTVVPFADLPRRMPGLLAGGLCHIVTYEE